MLGVLVIVLLQVDLHSEEVKCFQQLVTSCVKLGRLYEQRRQYEKALTFYDAACILEDGESCAILSYVYSKSLWGIQKSPLNLRTSLEYSKRAIRILGHGVNQLMCQRGSPSGCLIFGNYKKENGDDKGAQMYYSRAKNFAENLCRNSDGEGCLVLGQMYFYGLGVTQNKSRAFELIKRSCDELEYVLGCFFLSGFFGDKSEQKLRYLEKACSGGHHNACFELWRDTGKDEFFNKACEFGGQDICDLYRSEKNFRSSYGR